jgi:light-regulated signal transduction histidine kinase (bacteriophytochrome)
MAFQQRDDEMRGLFYGYLVYAVLMFVVLGIILRDLSARKRSEENLGVLNEELKKKSFLLERSNKELEQFAYIASHDLQEPLRMVASFTQLLERKFGNKLDAQGKEYIHYAVDGAVRMQRLIDDLLMFSRVGFKSVSPERVDLNDVCSQLLKDMQLLVDENRAVIQWDRLPVVLAGSMQMKQLFQNLISNAIKYRSEAAPDVKISCRKVADLQWEFIVSDNGIGIDPKYFDKLFVIFQRLHTQKVYKGTGIGLALCKKIVENHNGRIWVESKPGEGSAFHFILSVEAEIL